MSEAKDKKEAAHIRQSGGLSPKRRPLRDDVAEIDSAILQLLLKRFNLLQKIRKAGHLDPVDEKHIREHWQNAASRVSRDPELSGRFFTLLQGIDFLPKTSGADNEVQEGQKREAFNLHPAPFPVRIDMEAPAADWPVLAWLYLGAASGAPVRVSPTTQSSAVVDFTKGLARLGASISRLHETVPGRQYEVIATRPGEPMGRPDEVIHAGSSPDVFLIFLAHYLGRPSRVKFMGDAQLKLADLAPLRHVLPALGARLTSIVPKSGGLPARLECSAMLPAAFDFESDLPEQFGQALILAAPFYEQPFAIDFKRHPARENIFSRALPIMDASGAVFSLDDYAISLEPSSLALPATPDLPVEPSLAAFLLSLTEPLRGDASLSGFWPDWPEAQAFWRFALDCQLPWKLGPASISASNKTALKEFKIAGLLAEKLEDLPKWSIPLVCALAACAALAKGSASLPQNILKMAETGDFLRACKLTADEDGAILINPEATVNPVWAAPSPAWAMALALAACVNTGNAGFRLANPGIMIDLWPGFWQVYNGLPKPRAKSRPAPAEPAKKRRRILTEAVSEPPELKEEDWD